jgi:O-antigen/teichoic acid export membrane protein
VLLNVLGQAGSLIVGFVPAILVARWLGPADRGLYAVIATTSGIVFVLVAAGLPMAVMYFASRRPAPTRTLLGNSLAWAAVLALVLVPATALLDDRLADLFGQGQGGLAWVLAAVLIPFTFLDWTTHNQLLGAGRFGLYNTLVVLSKVVFLVGVVLLLHVVPLGVSGVYLATLAGSLLVIGGALRPILAAGRPRLDGGLLRRMLSYGGRTQVGGVFQYMNSRFDVLILQFFRPLSAVGTYVVAQTLAELVMLLARSFQSSVLPAVTRDTGDPESQAQTTAAALRHHGLLAAGAVLVNCVIGPVLIVLAYGPAFHAALVPFFVILPGIWFLGTGLVIANDLNGRGRPGLASTLSGLAVALTAALDVALIPPFGVVGAAAASLVAYTVFGVASLVVVARVARIRLRSLVPTRADLALYPAAGRRLLARVNVSGARGG